MTLNICFWRTQKKKPERPTGNSDSMCTRMQNYILLRQRFVAEWAHTHPYAPPPPLPHYTHMYLGQNLLLDSSFFSVLNFFFLPMHVINLFWTMQRHEGVRFQEKEVPNHNVWNTRYQIDATGSCLKDLFPGKVAHIRFSRFQPICHP